MNIQAIAHLVHSINLRRFAKPTALCLIAVFAISTLAALSMMPAKAATPQTSALHTQGSYILDASGNVVYLRGMGVAGMAPNLILWEQGGTDNWGDQWNNNPKAAMDQTFQTMQSQWHINMIRVFVYPSWYYRDNIVPATEDPGSYGAQTTPISTRAYLRTLCEEADKYGIYVDIVPYMLTPSTSSFGADPYASTGFGWQGMPMMGWDDAGNRFLSDAGYGSNEQAFWSWFWTDMANNLKGYPNAIFEAWNEPNMGSDVDAIPQGYMTYLQTMYSAIRGTGATNLIMMQWHMGWQPNGYGNDLSWAAQINNAIHPTNIVYTTHFYYYAPTDLSSYWAKDTATLKSQIQTGISSMGVTAPLVINEEGSCLSSSPNHQNDLTWWTNLVVAQRDLGLGACAYYWLSDEGLGGVYSGETMLSGGYSPNSMGQAYINGYNGASIAAPQATATPAATTAPTEQPQPTQSATETSNTSITSTSMPSPQTPTNTPTSTQEPSQTTLTIRPLLNQPIQYSGKGIVQNNHFGHWLSFHWPPYHFWFGFRF